MRLRCTLLLVVDWTCNTKIEILNFTTDPGRAEKGSLCWQSFGTLAIAVYVYHLDLWRQLKTGLSRRHFNIPNADECMM